MNDEASPSWPSLVSTSGDEFANFLDLPDLDIDFTTFDDNTGADSVQEDQFAPRSRYGQGGFYAGDAGMSDDTMLPKSASATDMHALKGQISGLQAQAGSHTSQRQGQMGQQPMPYHSAGRIPPTPSSLEMRGNHNQFIPTDPQQQAIYEAHMRKQQEQMVFTPLGTPAVTPLDSQYQMPEYAIPGEYFSPLASPALIAQSTAPPERAIYPHFHASDHSETTSPVDMNFDSALKTAATSAPANKRQKKQSPSRNARQGVRSVRQSPAVKPQRKKQSTSAVISAKEVAEVMANANRPTTSGSNLSKGDSLKLPASQNTSESGSISPEPLSDLMPPPATPKPGSSSRSPNIPSQAESLSGSLASGKGPATPRSLMKIQQPDSKAQGAGGDLVMQDISLGEAAMGSATLLPNIDTEVGGSQATPTISAQKGDRSASAMSPTTVLPSPATSTAPTPKAINGKAKNEFKAPAKGKKRNSSSHPSPALRPRISPSIKPLLPEGATMNAETSALLLASKSNYQNLIEGTHLPGVTYPEALSENLTSKRTSHKIAEQGRRNRINTALHEIASLLPQGRGGTDSEASAAAVSPPTPQANSKATTVEAAIDYIKSLQAELKATKGKLADAEGKLSEIRGLSRVEKDDSNGATISD